MALMYYLIYKTTNNITGKFYIGTHKTNNKNDNYMGSGKYLNYALQKYGLENFTKEILFEYNNADDMFAKEAEIVNEDFLASENTYNLKKGGTGGFDYINQNELYKKGWKNRTEESIRKMRDSGSVGGKKSVVLEKGFHNSDNRKDGWKSEEQKINCLKASMTTEANNKRKETFQHIKHQSGNKNSQFGTIWITDGVISRKIKSIDAIPNGWKRGRHT